jgi:hypothetical protein
MKMSDDVLDIDPDAVDIGDAVKSDDTKYAIAFAVVDVNAEDQRVKVYSPTMENTVHRWVDMDSFSVHVPNEDIQTNADREAWLNETLPQMYRDVDGERRELEYVINEDGTVATAVRA